MSKKNRENEELDRVLAVLTKMAAEDRSWSLERTRREALNLGLLVLNLEGATPEAFKTASDLFGAKVSPLFEQKLRRIHELLGQYLKAIDDGVLQRGIPARTPFLDDLL